MKTKLSNIIAVFAIITIGIVVSVIACDDKPTDPVACNCEQTYGTTAHLGIGETCPCPASKPCGCTEQTATLSNGTTTVTKEKGVSVEEFNDIVTLMNEIWSACNAGMKTMFTNNIIGIHVQKAGSSISHQGKILSIECDVLEDDLWDYLYDNNLITAQ
jgi:hypothetical protein